MKIIRLTIVLLTICALSACVTKKKYDTLDQSMKMLQNDKLDCETKTAKNQITIKKLNDQVKDLQGAVDSFMKKADEQAADKGKDNNQLVNVLKEMAVLTPEQAEGVNQSLQAIGTSGMTPEALKATLVSNLKSAIGGDSDTDISVQSDKGSLYIDLTDHMFFNSGSSDLTPRAKMVIGKVAKILNAYPDMHFMIQGHTDNKPMHTACVPDNWDLSIRRATSVVRVLQKEYGIKPERMIAAGHGEYDPIAANDTPVHRAENRRITIVITPQLDQFFKLLVKK